MILSKMKTMSDGVLENPAKAEFEVNFTRNHIVKAFNNSLSQKPNHVLKLSNLDLLSGRFPVTYFYFYRNPSDEKFRYSSLLENLKSSLAVTLEHYYPFSGRIVQNPDTTEPHIICDNSGALIVEAEANIELKDFDFHNLDESLKGKLVLIRPEFGFQAQVTRYVCGGISITFTFDHALGDASAFGKFLVSWSEISRNEPISCVPNHDRDKIIFPRDPPSYDSWLDRSFVKCTAEEISNIPTTRVFLKRLYFIDESSVDRLQSEASVGGDKRTKIEAFSAYVWKLMARAVDPREHETCKMGWLVDGRTRMSSRDQTLMSSYIGNVLSLGFGEARVGDLERKSVREVAGKVHVAIGEVAREGHFLDLIDWVECHRPGMMLSRDVLGRGGPALVLSSGRRFPVAEVDFGFGGPVLGTVCSTVERIGVAYMNQRPSAVGDGSWTVSAILWPELAAVFEKDSVFQPMTARRLRLV